MNVIRRAVEQAAILAYLPDGWHVCGERTSDPRLILGAIFGSGVARWPRAPRSRA